MGRAKRPNNPKGDNMIEKYQDKQGLYRWRLLARNGNIIAESGQGYKSKKGLSKGLAAERWA